MTGREVTFVSPVNRLGLSSQTTGRVSGSGSHLRMTGLRYPWRSVSLLLVLQIQHLCLMTALCLDLVSPDWTFCACGRPHSLTSTLLLLSKVEIVNRVLVSIEW